MNLPKITFSHKTTISDTLFICFFTFLPTLISIAFILIRSEELVFSKFYKAGEFLLYAVSFFSSSYLVYEQLNFKKRDWKSDINRAVLVALVLIAICFAISTAIPNPNILFLNWTSLIFITISIITFYHSQYLNNKKSIDVGDVRRIEQDEISNALE